MEVPAAVRSRNRVSCAMIAGRMRWIRAAALLLLASASVRAATLTVTEPAAAALRGGSFAPLAWIPDSLPAGAEEWEAFLSIDGGAHYAFRITPHVDLALHRILWLVPNVDADDARILVRIGDEREEESIDVALSLRIKRDPRAPLPRPAVIPAPAGEPARSGEPGVTWWIEGDRKATRTVEMWHVKPAGLM